MKKAILSIFLVMIALISATVPVSAEEYSTEYPDMFNSGSPLWIHCEIQNMGEYVIVIDPNTNIQSFGFDSPTGYNLINNTGSSIYGRAYAVNSNAGYSACWYSFYCLSLKTGTNASGNLVSYEPYTITKIYGTTLDLIDLVGDRGNDYYKGLSPTFRVEFLIHLAVGVIIIVVNALLFMRRRFN